MRVVSDRKEGSYFIGRTEFGSSNVDKEVLIDASIVYLKTAEYHDVKITDAADLDLYVRPSMLLQRKLQESN